MTVDILDPQKSVAQVVLEHVQSARVFHSHKIDYCCRGGRSLSAAAKERGVELDHLLRDLQEAIDASDRSAPQAPEKLSTPDLIQHIVATHHSYTRQAVPFIANLATKVAKVHGDKNTKLIALTSLIAELSACVLPHLDEEEQVLFPLLMSNPADDVKVAIELGSMVTEHFAVGRLLEKIRAAADDFVSPSWACGSYQTLMSSLVELERDIHTHVHLENYVLEPRFAESEGGVSHAF